MAASGATNTTRPRLCKAYLIFGGIQQGLEQNADNSAAKMARAGSAHHATNPASKLLSIYRVTICNLSSYFRVFTLTVPGGAALLSIPHRFRSSVAVRNDYLPFFFAASRFWFRASSLYRKKSGSMSHSQPFSRPE